MRLSDQLLRELLDPFTLALGYSILTIAATSSRVSALIAACSSRRVCLVVFIRACPFILASDRLRLAKEKRRGSGYQTRSTNAFCGQDSGRLRCMPRCL